MEEYYPKKYLTCDLLSGVLSELKLDFVYKIEDDLPDGIEVIFAESSVYFSEYAEGEISVCFLASQINTEKDLSLADALSVVAPNINISNEYLIKENLPFASKEKVSYQVKNALHLIFKYLDKFILFGDDTWIKNYKERELNS